MCFRKKSPKKEPKYAGVPQTDKTYYPTYISACYFKIIYFFIIKRKVTT